MRDQPLTARNQHDEDGMPAGGTAHALGLEVNFQDGPLQVSDANGTFVETLIRVSILRLEFYESAPRCSSRFNQRAIHYLYNALNELNARTSERVLRGVEGTHEA